MRCLYREQKTIHGNYMDIDIYPVFKQTGGRGKKAKPTSETQALLNQKNRERNLTWTLNDNFTPDDVKCEFTYSDENQPKDDKQAQRDIKNAIERMIRARKRKGLPPIKYVYVTEKGKRNGRYHHHIIMSGGLTPREIAEIWGKGYVDKIKPLQFNEYGIAGIAHYFVKDPLTGKHWCASRNLKKPVKDRPRPNDYKFSARKVKELAKDKECREPFEKLYPDYFFADCQALDNKYNNGMYITIRMYKKTVRIM